MTVVISNLCNKDAEVRPVGVINKHLESWSVVALETDTYCTLQVIEIV